MRTLVVTQQCHRLLLLLLVKGYYIMKRCIAFKMWLSIRPITIKEILLLQHEYLALSDSNPRYFYLIRFSVLTLFS